MAGMSLVSGRFESGGGSWGREVLSLAVGEEKGGRREEEEKGEVGLWVGTEKKRKRKRE